MTQTLRFWRNKGGLRGAILRHRALRKPVVQAVDFLTDLEVPGAIRFGDYSREFVSRHWADALLTRLGVRSGIPKQFRRRNSRCDHPDQHLIGAGTQSRNVFFYQ